MPASTGHSCDVFTFAKKHPTPHVIVGYYDPREQIDEEAVGKISYFRLLGSMHRFLPLVGEFTGVVESGTATMRWSYALADDAEHIAKLVGAAGADRPGNHASIAFFIYDRVLYDKLSALLDEKMELLQASWERAGRLPTLRY